MVLGNILLKYPNLSFSYFGTLQKSLGAGRAYGRVITRRPHRLTLTKQHWWRCLSKIVSPNQILWELSKVAERSSTINLSDYHYFRIFITFVKPTLAYKYVQIQIQTQIQTHLGWQICTNTKTNTIQTQTHLGWQIQRWYWALHGWCWKQTSFMTFSLWMIKR